MSDSGDLTLGGLQVHPSIFGLTRGDRCELSVCKAACCRNGVWVDEAHIAQVRACAEEIIPNMEPERRDPAAWFDYGELMLSDDFISGRGRPTEVIIDPEAPDHDTCVFRRRDHLCALQLTDPSLKPFDCYTYPVLRSEGELTMDLQSPKELGGADCQRAHAPPRKVIEVFEGELRLVLGDTDFEALQTEGRRRP